MHIQSVSAPIRACLLHSCHAAMVPPPHMWVGPKKIWVTGVTEWYAWWNRIPDKKMKHTIMIMILIIYESINNVIPSKNFHI